MKELAKRFTIPPHLNASAPIELQGVERDEVKLMVLDRQSGKYEHARFKNLPDYLNKGDVLVLNNSRTLPASLKGRQGNRLLEVRLSRKISHESWDALVVGDVYQTGEPIYFAGGVQADMMGEGSEKPLVRLEFNRSGGELFDFIYRNGDPVRYEYIQTPLPLEYYQTVYGSVPGSVEMTSAGRAFSWKLIQSLKQKGIEIAFVQLHAGLSYYGDDRWPTPRHHPEEYHVSSQTADMIRKAKNSGNRVIAVGTTVVRALETVMEEYGRLHPADGVTNLYISRDTPLQLVDGLITGFHEPEASHLDLLTAFISEEKLLKAYQTALMKKYTWHEFGDMNIIL